MKEETDSTKDKPLPHSGCRNIIVFWLIIVVIMVLVKLLIL